MSEGASKNKLKKAAKKISDAEKPAKASAPATDLADIVSQMKQQTKTYVFAYKATATKADPVNSVAHDSDADSDTDKANEKALEQRMQSTALREKATRTMKMLMSNCLQNSFLFWKGAMRPNT